MSSAWRAEGPVSVPPRVVAYGAGVILVLLALLGLALGLRASSRQAPGPGFNSSSAASDDATNARPLVEFAPPVAPPPAAEPGKTDAEKAQEAAAQSAAQAVQAKPSKPNGSIDEILASPTEKPPAPVKPGPDEAPPPANQSDVPF